MRTSNPIESTFATVRLRTDKAKGCFSRDIALAPPGSTDPVSFGDRRKGLLAFAGLELAKSAERHWRKLDGANRLGQLIEGVEFRNGEPVQDAERKIAA